MRDQNGKYIERRGGKRAGAGRKRKTDVLVTYNLHITHAQAELLKMWGDGDMSAGLRWLIDVAGMFIREKAEVAAQVSAPHDPPRNNG